MVGRHPDLDRPPGRPAVRHALEAGGARRILYDFSFFSAPQLKRAPLDSAFCENCDQ
jgi:hypothetical protein